MIEVHIYWNNITVWTSHTFVLLFHLHSCVSVCVMIYRLNPHFHTNHERQPLLLLHPGVVSLYMSEKLASCEEFNMISTAIKNAIYRYKKIGVFWHSKPAHDRYHQWKCVRVGVFYGEIIELQEYDTWTKILTSICFPSLTKNWKIVCS